MSEDTQPLDIREKSQLLACRLSHGLLSLSLATEKAGSWACLHSFLLTADRALPVSAAHEVDNDWWVTQWPLYHMNPDATRTQREYMPTKNKGSAFFSNQCWNEKPTNSELDQGWCSEAECGLRTCGRAWPSPAQAREESQHPTTLCVTTPPQGGAEVSFSPQLSPFSMRDSNKRRHATVLRRGQELWKL